MSELDSSKQALDFMSQKPAWPGPRQGKPLENFTGATLFSVRSHNKLVALLNALYNLHIIGRTGGTGNQTQSEAIILYSDDRVDVDLNLNILTGANITVATINSVRSDYLVCTTTAGATVYVAKQFKHRLSLSGVTEFSVPWTFFYEPGPGSLKTTLLGLAADANNLLRLKTKDGSQSAFPTNNSGDPTAGGYDKTKGELELVIPVWTINSLSPADVIFAISCSTGLSTASPDPAGMPITLLDIGDSRQWAKVDAPLSTFAGNIQFS